MNDGRRGSSKTRGKRGEGKGDGCLARSLAGHLLLSVLLCGDCGPLVAVAGNGQKAVEQK